LDRLFHFVLVEACTLVLFFSQSSRFDARLAAGGGKKRRRVVTVCDSSDSSDGEVVTVDSSDDEVVVVADKEAVDAQAGPSHVIPAKEESQGLTTTVLGRAIFRIIR
jgi:hypothetical protein